MSKSSQPPPAFNTNGTPAAQLSTGQQQQQIGDWLHGGSAPGAAQAQNNYIGAAQAQAASGQQNAQQQTQANRPDQNTAFGFSQWHQNPDGSWAQNTGLNGPLAGAANSLQAQAEANAGKTFDNGSAARDQAITGAYNQATSRLDPQWNQRQEQMGAQLANQGLDPNSAAYRNAMQQFGQQRNDAYGSAMNSAIGQGTAAQQATFGENMAAQMAPYQQMQQLFGLGGAPQFFQAGMAGATQYLPAVMGYGNYQLGQQQNDNQVLGSAAGGLGELGAGAMLAFSDERLKDDIERHDVEALPGVPVATWEYKDEPGVEYRGVIAQDLEKVAPEYVHHTPGGIKAVDYSFSPFLFKRGK